MGHGSVGEAVKFLRQALLVARFSQAMAELSRGEKFLIVTPDINPYTIPKDTFDRTPNVWRQYAFPYSAIRPLRKSPQLLMLLLMRGKLDGCRIIRNAWCFSQVMQTPK